MDTEDKGNFSRYNDTGHDRTKWTKEATIDPIISIEVITEASLLKPSAEFISLFSKTLERRAQ